MNEAVKTTQCCDHNHDHQHDHHHDHEHNHHHFDYNSDDKDIALLKYMVEHNEHHADEVAAMAEKLRADGNIEAAEELEQGVADFEAGNAHLSKAYYMLKGEI